MTDKLEQQDLAAVRNPADYINTYEVTLRDNQTGEEVKTRTHNFSIEECALDLKDKLKSQYSVVSIYQPDTKTSMNEQEYLEL